VTVTKVVDASALAAIAFAEPEAESVAERLDGLAQRREDTI
jgi:uncharacterized protein with PIN domain